MEGDKLAKEYPLEIHPIVEFQSNGQIQGYYSKGHHEANLFLPVFNEQEKPGWVNFDIDEADIEHGWTRNLPDGDGGIMLQEAIAGTRGAYPTTQVDFHRAANRRMWAAVSA